MVPELWLNRLHFSYPFFFIQFVSLKFLVDFFLPFLLKTPHFLHQSLRNLLNLRLLLFLDLWKISFDSIFVLDLRKSFRHLFLLDNEKLYMHKSFEIDFKPIFFILKTFLQIKLGRWSQNRFLMFSSVGILTSFCAIILLRNK